MIIGLLAIMKTGAAYVPLDPEFPNECLLAILSDCKVRAGGRRRFEGVGF